MDSKEKPIIGIIGGRGKMGIWFADFLSAQDYELLLSDMETELTNEQLIAKADVVIFSLPIDKTTKVIEGLAHLGREEQLWLDLTSVKQLPVKAMLRSKAEVVGSHPMFGPSVDKIQGQTVVVCPARVKRWDGWWEKLLTAAGAKVKISTPAEHDQVMAVVQGLTHFSAITISYALRELGVDLDKSSEYTSPVYRIHLDMSGRILAQDPELYADIQMNNPSSRAVLEKYMQAVAKLFRIVEQRDKEAFVRYFCDAAEHLGTSKDEALQESDYLINLLINRQARKEGDDE